MTFRLIDKDWGTELEAAYAADPTTLRVVSPFIKLGAVIRLLGDRRPRSIQVITRFNLDDFAGGVSDIAALRHLLNAGAKVRGIRNLHAKLYLFGMDRAVVTSANLTKAALDRNHEFGVLTADAAAVSSCQSYFSDLWRRGRIDLTAGQLDDWCARVTSYLASGARPDQQPKLGDLGEDVGFAPESEATEIASAPTGQAFVKFLGQGSNRVPLSHSTIDEVRRSGCHWALGYPASKRPTGVQDGAIMFIARLTREPPDIRVFGRAVGLRHVPGRDDASDTEKLDRSWKHEWPRYIRVHHAEFIAGDLTNGVSLNELMATLGSDSFLPTQRNAARGEGNTDPRLAYMQQAAVRLSPEGWGWLSQRLDAAFARHGKVPAAALAELDWPESVSAS